MIDESGKSVAGPATAGARVPVIQVANYNLLANTPNQKIQIFISGNAIVRGADVEVQIADGGPSAGGKVLGPKITHVDIVNGTIFANNHTGQAGIGSKVPQVFEATTIARGNGVTSLGLLATITIDTTGFTSGTFPLLLTGTVNGNTDFAGLSARVTNGSIIILPPPATPAPAAPKAPAARSVFNDGDRRQESGERSSPWAIDVDQLINGKDLIASAGAGKNDPRAETGVDPNAYDIYVVTQTQKGKGTGKPSARGPFGEKPIG